MTVSKNFTVILGPPQRVPTCTSLGFRSATPNLLRSVPAYQRTYAPVYYAPRTPQPHLLTTLPKAWVPVQTIRTYDTVFRGPFQQSGFPPVYKTLQVVLASQGPQTPRKFPVLSFAR